MIHASTPGRRVLLVNMPFASVNYPSLALGLFKARLERDGIACDVAYLNVLFARMVGHDNYGLIEQHSAALAGEQMFAHSLFGPTIPSDEEYATAILPLIPGDVQERFRYMKRHVEHFLQYCLQSIPWERYDIVGFTSLFEQNLSSLSLAYQVKLRHPDVTIVFGGANCEDVMGETLHERFGFVDFVCTGEADNTFPELIQRIRSGAPVDDVCGIIYRDGPRSVRTDRPDNVVKLDPLPFPDYDDFFRAVQHPDTSSWPRSELLVETSRGCWWGEKVMCTFCGLNGENIGFREKGPHRALREIEHLVERYGPRVVRAVDNIMPKGYYRDLLPELAKRDLGIELFYEVRAAVDKHAVRALADARVTTVQAGIESLNTNILRLMRKGTTGLRNIEYMRWCKEYGVNVDWNLLFGFPGETAEDYAASLETGELVRHLAAPSSVGLVRMDRFSVNFNRADEMGFVNVRPWKAYRYVYPFDHDTMMRLAYYFDCDYREPIDDGGLMPRLREQVASWRSAPVQFEAERKGGRLVIRDTRRVATAAELVLDGLAADIYECCDQRRTFEQIRHWLEQRSDHDEIDETDIERILARLVKRKLMLKEKGYYLSLAIMHVEPDPQREPRRFTKLTIRPAASRELIGGGRP